MKPIKFLFILVLGLLLGSCNSGVGAAQSAANGSVAEFQSLEIPTTGDVYLLENTNITIQLPVFNNSNQAITDISYQVVSGDSLVKPRISADSAEMCNTIPAHGHCFLEILIPALEAHAEQGGFVLRADAGQFHAVQPVNYRQKASPGTQPVLSVPTQVTTSKQKGHVIAWLYNASVSASYEVQSINTNDKVSIIGDKHFTLQPSSITPVILSISTEDRYMATVTVQFSHNHPTDNITKTDFTEQVSADFLVNPVNGGILINTSPAFLSLVDGKSSPNISFIITNAGNQNILIDSVVSAESEIQLRTYGGTDRCVDGMILEAGSTCTVYYTIVSGASCSQGNVIINYNLTSSLTVPVGWYASKDYAMVEISTKSNPVISNQAIFSESFIISNVGGYAISGGSLSVSYIESGIAEAIITGGTCVSNPALAVNSNCSVVLQITVQSGQTLNNALVQLKYTYTSNGQQYTQLYNKYLIYSTSVFMIAGQDGLISALGNGRMMNRNPALGTSCGKIISMEYVNSKVYVGTDAGCLFASVNSNGLVYLQVPVDYYAANTNAENKKFYDIAGDGNNTVIVSAGGGRIYSSTDNGVNWVSNAASTKFSNTATLYSVAYSPFYGRFFAAGIPGSSSTNGGEYASSASGAFNGEETLQIQATRIIRQITCAISYQYCAVVATNPANGVMSFALFNGTAFGSNFYSLGPSSDGAGGLPITAIAQSSVSGASNYVFAVGNGLMDGVTGIRSEVQRATTADFSSKNVTPDGFPTPILTTSPYQPKLVDAGPDNIAVFLANKVYTTANSGGNWESLDISSMIGSSSIRSATVRNTATPRWFVGAENLNIYYRTNASPATTNWGAIDQNSERITTIAAMANNPLTNPNRIIAYLVGDKFIFHVRADLISTTLNVTPYYDSGSADFASNNFTAIQCFDQDGNKNTSACVAVGNAGSNGNIWESMDTTNTGSNYAARTYFTKALQVSGKLNALSCIKAQSGKFRCVTGGTSANIYFSTVPNAGGASNWNNVISKTSCPDLNAASAISGIWVESSADSASTSGFTFYFTVSTNPGGGVYKYSNGQCTKSLPATGGLLGVAGFNMRGYKEPVIYAVGNSNAIFKKTSSADTWTDIGGSLSWPSQYAGKAINSLGGYTNFGTGITSMISFVGNDGLVVNTQDANSYTIQPWAPFLSQDLKAAGGLY